MSKLKVGDRVHYFTDPDTPEYLGTVTDLFRCQGNLIAEVNHEYTCFAGDLVRVNES